MPTNKISHEFKVVIEGIELPSEFKMRINQALQRTVLLEMTSADFRGKDLVFTPIMGQMVSEDAARGTDGSTGGARCRVASVTSQ